MVNYVLHDVIASALARPWEEIMRKLIYKREMTSDGSDFLTSVLTINLL